MTSWDDDDDDINGLDGPHANASLFERAVKALERFKGMQYQLTTYAQAITDNPKLKIEAGSEAGVRGNIITIMPPLELSETQVHEYSLCDRRDEDGMQRCPACHSNEAIMARLYHDIAHVAFHSFEKPDAGHATFMEKASDEQNDHVKNVLMGFEDSRVNRAIFAARPGVGAMYDAMIRTTIEHGVEITTTDEKTKATTTEIVKWPDMHADYQIVLGMNLKLTDYDPGPWLHPEVSNDLEDEHLNKLLGQVRKHTDVRENYRHAGLVYKYLKDELGYFKDEEKPEDDPQDGDGDGDGDGSIKGDASRPMPDSACVADQVAPQTDEQQEAMAQAMQDNQLQTEMERAVQQAEYFEQPSVAINGIDFIKYDTACWPRQRGRIIPAQETVLGNALLRMRVAFEDNARSRNLRNLKSGKVNTRVLGRRAAVEDPRLFRKKVIPAKKDYFVVIGVDQSGSTRGSTLRLEQEVVNVQAELLHRLGIPFAIYGHSGGPSTDGGTRERSYWGYTQGFMLYITKIKEEHDPWDTNARQRLFDTQSLGANLDGHALEFLRKRADQSQSKHKVIIYGSDGEMPAENYEEELEILTREIKMCKRRNHTLLGLGIETDSPTRHGLDTVEVYGQSDIGKVIKQLDKYLRTVI